MTQNKQKDKSLDQSIIDVNKENLDLTIEQLNYNNNNSLYPPCWNHFNVSSFDDIEYANKNQKIFYFYFRNKVLNNEFVNIQGNKNYALILHFELHNEYEISGDVKLLYERVNLLLKICPDIKETLLYLLIHVHIGSRSKDNYSGHILKKLLGNGYDPENGFYSIPSSENKLGRKYSKILQLTGKEIYWLNKVKNYNNSIMSIEKFRTYTIKQFCLVLHTLEKNLNIKNLVGYIRKEIENNLIRKKDSFSDFERLVYSSIFEIVENSMRVAFKISYMLPTNILIVYSTRVQSKFDKGLGALIYEIIENNKLKEPDLDLQTQISLNSYDSRRWKSEFANLKVLLESGDKEGFIKGVEFLEMVNEKNSSLEVFYFEMANTVASVNNTQALKYYAKYIYHNLYSRKNYTRKLFKTVQKILFNTEKQKKYFEEIITELIETADIQKTLNKVEKIYIIKRKKIKLDKSVINEVEQKYDGTVKLLNGYLGSEIEKVNQLNYEKEKVERLVIQNNTSKSIFISGINIGKIQEELIAKIVSNSFEIHQEKVDKFAIENGFLKNQLIDSINEVFEEYLEGEALIEEDGDNYIIEKSYYKEIIL